MLRLIVVLSMSTVTTPMWAGSVTLVFETDLEKYTVTFDPLKIPETEVRQLIALSPYTGEDVGPFSVGRSNDNGIQDKIFTAPPLESCSSNDPDYLPCGSRDFHDPHFLANAEVNIRKAEKQLSLLNNMRYPKELGPVVKHLKNSLSFFLWMSQTRLEYYKTWNTDVLKRTYDNFDPSTSCRQVLQQIESTASNDKKYSLAEYKWQHCILDGFQSELGRYPMEAWMEFLKDYGIVEQYTEENID